jgi:galactose oxidase-like protein
MLSSPTRFGMRLALLISTVLIVGVPTPSFARVVPGSAERIGHWDAPFDEGGGATGRPVGQAMAVLADGRLFYFQGREDNNRDGGARLLDLRRGLPAWTDPAATSGDGNMFCSDLAMLGDGRILMAGGGDPASLVDGDSVGVAPGTPQILNPGTGALTRASVMRRPRWYPSLVALADGKAMVVGGTRSLLRGKDSKAASGTETYDPEADTWTENHSDVAAEASLPPQPRLFLMPNGKVFYPGVGQAGAPGQNRDEALWSLQQFLDPATGKWELAGPSPWGMRDTATSVLLPLNPPYDKATVLTFGGTAGPASAGGVSDSLSMLTTVDRQGRVTNSLTAPTRHTRWFSSAVSLPDGTVLALGGASDTNSLVPGTELPTRSAELFAPWAGRANDVSDRGGWFPVASPSRDRTDHNAAVLLPDGRVLLGGHAPAAHATTPSVGGPFASMGADSSFEVYSPPYLFRGPRPAIRRAPAGIRWGETFPVDTRQALGIESVVLMRLPSPQHVNDSDARTLRLRFTRAHSGRLQVQAPPDGFVAPPGYYYLFINKSTDKGTVPSVARLVRLGNRSEAGEALQPYADEPEAPRGSASFTSSPSLASTLWRLAADFVGRLPGPNAEPCTLLWGREGAGCK